MDGAQGAVPFRYVLLLDTETTGLPSEPSAKCIEVAVALYDLDNASVMMSYGSLIGPTVENPAESVNRIKPSMLSDAPDAISVWNAVARISESAGCFVAHRAEFDSLWVPRGVVGSRSWVCSKIDIDWGGRRGDHLVHLALDLGLGVSHAHRAMSDVDILARCLTRASEMGMDLREMFRLALRPKKRFVARVPFEMNETIKKYGFMWSGLPRKEWYRFMPPEDAVKLPFYVVESPT